MRFKKNKSNFLWNPAVSGIVCSGCGKGTLFLINGEVAFWGKFDLGKKNNETHNGVEVSALPLFIILFGGPHFRLPCSDLSLDTMKTNDRRALPVIESYM